MTAKPITRLLAILAIFAIALPVAADEPGTTECVTVHLAHDPGVHVERVDGYTDGEIRYSVVGSFVWFQWGHADNPNDGETDTLSFDVSDPEIVSATACLDGSVELTRVQSEPVGGEDPVPDVTPPAEPSPLSPVCELHSDVLEHYCTLPNRTLVIS